MNTRTSFLRAAALALLLAGCSRPEPTPTAFPTPVPDTPTPVRPLSTVVATPTPSGPPKPRLFVVVVMNPPNIRAGQKEAAKVDTLGGALCSLVVLDPVGNKTAGLFPKVAGDDGHLAWAWTVSATGNQGTYRATSECVLGETKASGNATFRVY